MHTTVRSFSFRDTKNCRYKIQCISVYSYASKAAYASNNQYLGIRRLKLPNMLIYITYCVSVSCWEHTRTYAYSCVSRIHCSDTGIFLRISRKLRPTDGYLYNIQFYNIFKNSRNWKGQNDSTSSSYTVEE